MKLNKKASIIASSVAAIALSSSLIAGSTYALFTSNSSVNVAVTSAKVSVLAKIDRTYNEKVGYVVESSLGNPMVQPGFIADDELQLSNIAPGDSVKVKIDVTNYSSINVLYKARVTITNQVGNISDVLEVATLSDSVPYDGTWNSLAAAADENGDDLGSVYVTISLPEGLETEQGAKCTVSFTVEAIQGNAETPWDGVINENKPSTFVNDYENKTITLKDEAAFMYFMEKYNMADDSAAYNLANGKAENALNDYHYYWSWTIVLDKDMNLGGETIKPLANFGYGKLDGQGHKISNFNVNSTSGLAGLFEKIYDNNAGGGKVENLTISDAHVTTTGKDSYAGILCGYTNGDIKNVHILNSSATSTKYAGAIAGDAYSNITGCSVEETTVKGGKSVGGLVGFLPKESGADTTVSVKGNTLKNVTVVGTSYVGAFIGRTSLSNGNIVISDNTVTGGSVNGAVCTSQNFIAGFPNKAPTVENNTVNGETFSIAAADKYLACAEDLVDFSAAVNNGNTYAGKTVVLTADVDLSGVDWTPIGTNADSPNKFKGVFDGQNHIISNLRIVRTEAKYEATGLFGALEGTLKNLVMRDAYINSLSLGNSDGNTDNGIAVVAGSVYQSGNINHVTVENSEVCGNRYVAGIAGYVYGNVDYCTVKGTTIIATPDTLTGSYDNGDKVGGIVGYLADDTHTLTHNTVEGCTIKAWRDVGGIGGCVKLPQITVTDNTVINTTVGYVENNEYSRVHENCGDIIGRNTGSGTLDVDSNKVIK